jgi:hypothetical protein
MRKVIGADGAPIERLRQSGGFKGWPSRAQVDVISVINPLLIDSRKNSLIISSRVQTRTDALIDSVILVERIGVVCSS